MTGERAEESKDAGREALLIFADYVNKGEAWQPRAKNTTTNGMCAARTVINNFTGTPEGSLVVSRWSRAEAFRDPNPSVSFVCVCPCVSTRNGASRAVAALLEALQKRERERERVRAGVRQSPAAPAAWHIHILCGEKSVRTGTSSRAVLGSALWQLCVTPFL